MSTNTSAPQQSAETRPPVTPEDAVREAFEAGRWDEVCRIVEPRLALPGVVLHLAHGLVGLAYAMQGEASRAEVHLERACELGATEPDVLARLAIMVRHRSPQRALELVVKAFETSRRFDLAMLAGRIVATDLGHPLEAIPWFERASTLHSTRVSSALIAALECAVACGSRATLSFAERIANEPSANEGDLVKGVVALASTADATLAFDRLIQRLGPRAEIDDLVILRIEQALVSGRGLEALMLARRLHAADAGSERARRTLAAVLCRLGESLDEAEELLTPVSPEHLDSVYELGRAFAARGLHDRALALLLPLEEVFPDHVELQILLAQLHDLAGNRNRAERAFGAARAGDWLVNETASEAQTEIETRLSLIPQALKGTRLSSLEFASLHRGHNSLLVGLCEPKELAAPAPLAFVKVYRPHERAPEQVEAERDLLQWLASYPETAPHSPRVLEPASPLIDLAGWYGFAMTAVTGVPLPSKELYAGTLSKSRTSALGAALARLQHRFLRTVHETPWQRPIERGMACSLAPVLAWARSNNAFRADIARLGLGVLPHIDAIETHLEALRPAFCELAERGLERGVIHGDFAAHNTLWTEGEVSAIVDFDYSTRDFSATDLAICLSRSVFDWDRLNRTGDPAYDATAAQALLQSYMHSRTSLGMAPLPLDNLEDLELVHIGIRVTYNLAFAGVCAAANDELARTRLGPPSSALSNLVRQLDWLTTHRPLFVV